MQKKSNERRAFIEACKKSGLNVNGETSDFPAKGIIIKDGKGNKYTVTPNMELIKTSLSRKGALKPILDSVATRQKKDRTMRRNKKRRARILEETVPTKMNTKENVHNG